MAGRVSQHTAITCADDEVWMFLDQLAVASLLMILIVDAFLNLFSEPQPAIGERVE